MTMDIQSLTYQQATRKLSERFEKGEIQKWRKKRKFYHGDHWQNGEGWSGPLPAATDEKSNAMNRIERAFVSRNAITEVVGRHASAVIGKEPHWAITSKRQSDDDGQEQRESRIDAIEKDLVSWWDEKQVHLVLQESARSSLWGRYGTIRIFIPSSEIQPGDEGITLVSASNLPEALSKIHVEHVDADKAGVITDKQTMKRVGIYTYEDGESKKYFEVSYLNEDGQTILEIKRASEEKAQASDPISLDGNLLHYQINRKPIVSQQVVENQRDLNKSKTMWSINMDWAAFVESYFFNAEPPGKEVENTKTGEKEFKAEPMNTGPGSTNFVSGIVYQDEEGNERIANASGVFREPFDTTTFSTTKMDAYRAILEETHQTHALIAGESAPSGEARIQAMGDFVVSLAETKTEIDAAGRWMLQTVLMLAQSMTGQGAPDDLRVDFECRISPGPIPQTQIDQTIKLYEADLISRQRAMLETGVDDPDAEIDKIDTVTVRAEAVLKIMRENQIIAPSATYNIVRHLLEHSELLQIFSEQELTAIKEDIERDSQERIQSRDAVTSVFGSGVN